MKSTAHTAKAEVAAGSNNTTAMSALGNSREFAITRGVPGAILHCSC